MRPLVLHPRTIAKIIRNLKACCPNQDLSNVNAGWLVGTLTPKQRKILAHLDISVEAITPEQLERYFRNSKSHINTLRKSINQRIARALHTVVWPTLYTKRKAQHENTVNPRHPS